MLRLDRTTPPVSAMQTWSVVTSSTDLRTCTAVAARPQPIGKCGALAFAKVAREASVSHLPRRGRNQARKGHYGRAEARHCTVELSHRSVRASHPHKAYTGRGARTSGDRRQDPAVFVVSIAVARVL